MGSIFEIFMIEENPAYAYDAARACFEELDRLEEELSRFLPSSDVSRINSLAPGQRIRVGLAAMECLKLAAQVNADTNGAFDVTVGAILKCLRAAHDGKPDEGDLARALALTGMSLLEIDASGHSVGVRKSGVLIDLGAVGKGYALDRMAELLRDWSIPNAVLHGGQSSALAIGNPPGRKGWPLTLRDPQNDSGSLGHISLSDASLSGSGILLQGHHIVDPRTGRPATEKLGAWCAAPSGALSDCLSTAFMLMSPLEIERYSRQHPGVSAMIMLSENDGRTIMRFGASGPAFLEEDRSKP